MQALEKKAGKTTQYHPGFSITSAQLLRAIDELDIGASSGELKSILEAIFQVVGESEPNLPEPITTTDISVTISTCFPVTTVDLLKAVYEKIGKDPETVRGTATTTRVKNAVSSIETDSSYYVVYSTSLPDSIRTLGIYGTYISVDPNIDALPSDIDPTKITHLFLNNCSKITGFTNLDSMISLRSIDLTGISVSDWNSVIGRHDPDGDAIYTPLGLALLAKQYNLAHIIMPNSYTTVGDYVCYNCTKLQSINLPGVTSVGDGAFWGCKSLASLTIPFNCSMNPNTSNGYYFHFYNCSKLTTLYLIWPNDLLDKFKATNALTYDGESTFTLDLQKFLPDEESDTGTTVYKQITNIQIRQWDGSAVQEMGDSAYNLQILNCGEADNTQIINKDTNWQWVKS